MAKPKQQEMKHQPKIRRKKTDVIPTLDKACAKLDVSRSARLSAQTDEKADERKCNEIMAANDLTEYQLSDGRMLRYGPKSDTMGCKIVAAEEEHAAPQNGSLELIP